MPSAGISVMSGVRVVSASHGQRKWSLVGRTVEIVGTSARLFDVSADIDGFDMSVSAPEGRYDFLAGDMLLSGGVSLSGSDYRVKTQDLILDPERREIYSDSGVIIDGEGYVVTGTGLRAKGDIVRIVSNVKAIYY